MPLFADTIRGAYAALVVAALLVAGLVLGKEVLLPLAIASCLAFVLSPIVSWLQKRGLPRSLGVVFVGLVSTAILVAVSALIISQAVNLAADLGTYKVNLIEKIRTVTQSAKSDGVFRRATDAILSLETEITKEVKGTTEQPNRPIAGQDTRSPQQDKVIVTVDTNQKTIWDHLGVLAQPLTAAGLTMLFTLFMLAQTQDLRDRVIRIAGTDNVPGTTSALNDAAKRLSSLLLTQAMLNVGFGTAVGLILWMIGVPNSALWGGLTILMRFVPYVGSIIAAVPPVLLAAAVDPGWGMALATLMVFVIGEPIMGHVVEPVVLGSKAGLSPFAMLLSASFWVLIWGPVGLILAAPLTLTLVVLGRYVKGLEFLTVLLGDEPALSRPEKLYHRLLARDVLGSAQQVEDDDEVSLIKRTDAIILPALRIAAADLERGQLDKERVSGLRSTALEMMDVLESPDDEDDAPSKDDENTSSPHILLLAARSDVDKAAADFAALALDADRQIVARSVEKGTGLTAISAAIQAGITHPKIVAIVVTAPRDTQFLPLICKRAARAFPGSTISVLDVTSGSMGKGGSNGLADVAIYESLAQLGLRAAPTETTQEIRDAKAS